MSIVSGIEFKDSMIMFTAHTKYIQKKLLLFIVKKKQLNMKI